MSVIINLNNIVTTNTLSTEKTAKNEKENDKDSCLLKIFRISFIIGALYLFLVRPILNTKALIRYPALDNEKIPDLHHLFNEKTKQCSKYYTIPILDSYSIQDTMISKQKINDKLLEWTTPDGSTMFKDASDLPNDCFMHSLYYDLDVPRRYYEGGNYTIDTNAALQALDYTKHILSNKPRLGTGVIAYTKSDWNGAFEKLSKIERTLFKHFNTFAKQTGSEQELCTLLDKSRLQAGDRLDFAMINAHGFPNSIPLGDESITKYKSSSLMNCFTDNLKPSAPIILRSCSTSKREGGWRESIADSIAKGTGRIVMAPSENSHSESCQVSVDSQGKIFGYTCEVDGNKIDRTITPPHIWP